MDKALERLYDASHKAHAELNAGESYVAGQRAILGLVFVGFMIVIELLQAKDKS